MLNRQTLAALCLALLVGLWPGATMAQAGSQIEAAAYPNTINLALNRPARQSSTALGGSAARVVDGRTDGNWANNSVSHTDIELEPWWEVDLQQDTLITRVSLFNRTDCCSERLNNAIIIIYDENRRVVTRRSIGTAYTAMPFDMRFRGRYVRIQLPGREYLSLAEVRVFGQRQ